MQFIKVRDVKSPQRGTPESAGLDFFIPNDFGDVTIPPGQGINIPSGIKMILNPGTAGIFFNKSGVGVKGVLVGACVVDSDYRGEVHLNVRNTSDQWVVFKAGQKLVQMLIMNVDLNDPLEITTENFNSLADTKRGSGGFGSTGV